MADIIKTWPGFMPREKVRRVFSAPNFLRFYFSLGRGRPKQTVESIWFTHKGKILGFFSVERIIRYDGENIPPLRSLENRESTWQFIPGVHVAVCVPPCRWLEDDVFHESFRGWRYFNLTEYRELPDAFINLEAL